MINLQNPNIPVPTQAVEIDKAIYEMQLELSQKLAWLTHDYGRAYRHLEKNNKKFYFPEVYLGGKKNEYYRVTPDNDKKGTCFFVVGKEKNENFEQNQFNYIKWEVGIVFWVNLGLINNPLSLNEIYTQNLIKEVREVLTRGFRGNFAFKINSVERELKEIYKEFSLDEEQEYLRSPYSGFRFNLELVMQEECGSFMFDPAEALKNSISQEELLTILLPTIDFSVNNNFNALTPQQINDLTVRLCGVATVENSDQTWSATVGAGGTLVTPDIQFTDSDLQVYQLPSVKNISATPCPVKSGITYQRVRDTNVRQSYTIYDDFWVYQNFPYPADPLNPTHAARLDRTVATNLQYRTLVNNNIFGNTSRYTDLSGGPFTNIPTDGAGIDHLTGLMNKYELYTGTFAAALAYANGLNTSIYLGYNDWFVADISMVMSYFTFEQRYFAISLITDGSQSSTIGSSTTNFENTSQNLRMVYTSGMGGISKVSSQSFLILRKHL